MGRRLFVVLIGSVCLTGSAFADMIEVKSRGILNGKVLSQNDREVQFQDAKGKRETFQRTDVLYIDLDAADTGKSASGAIKTFQGKVSRMVEAAALSFRKFRGSAEKTMKKYTTVLAQPLDRSAADAKAKQLADAMDQANQATAALTKKNLAVNREIKRQTDEMNGSSKKGSGGSGRFSSLDN